MEEEHRRPTRERKPFIASREFWLGVATVFFGLMIVYGLATMFIG